MRIPHFCSGSPLDPPRIPTGSPADPQALRRSCQADSRVAPVDFVSYAQLFLPHRAPKLLGEHITICMTLQSDMLKRKVCQPPLSRNNVLKKVWNSKVGRDHKSHNMFLCAHVYACLHPWRHYITFTDETRSMTISLVPLCWLSFLLYYTLPLRMCFHESREG